MPFKLTIEMSNITEPGSSRSEVFCKPTTLSKKRLWQRCFPVYFAKFLRTPFLQNISGGFFWKLHIYSYLLILTQPAFICSNSTMKTAENLVRSSNRRSSLRAATLLKKRLAQVLSCEFCEISKNTFFIEHFWATASDITQHCSKACAILKA